MIRRPVIAPGLHVLTDPTGVVQLGLTPSHRLRVPDTPSMRRALSVLTRGETLPTSRDLQRARTLLEPALRDGDILQRPGINGADVAALALAQPETVASRLSARERSRVCVRGDLGVDFGTLLDAVGLRARSNSVSGSTSVLMLSQGEPARDPFDDLVRAEKPHLIVRAIESEIVIGPFVIPGETACLRCCDLHRTQSEPAYTRLLDDSVRARRSDGVGDPLDTAQCWIALGMAVRDLVRHAEGDRPEAWSSTLHLDPDAPNPQFRRWPPHPDCSCTWGARR